MISDILSIPRRPILIFSQNQELMNQKQSQDSRVSYSSQALAPQWLAKT